MQKPVSSYSDTELYALLHTETKEREEAFTELYTRYSSRVFLYCRCILNDRDLVRDVFQETWLRLLQGVERGRMIENVPAYLLRICRNLCFDIKKNARTRVIVSFEDFNFPVEDNALETKELQTLIATALEMLTDDYREAFILQAYNGLSYKEIAEVIDEPVSTVRNRVVRAKYKIREILAPYLVGYRP